MKISYGITVCDELSEIQELISFLLEHKRDEDEIVVTLDANNGLEAVRDYLKYTSTLEKFDWHLYPFEGNFSDLKNNTKKMCSGDYIFHLDADEIPHEILMEQLHTILEMNEVDLVWIPRVNTVDGITNEHIQKWGWKVSEKGWVNYPDYQARVFKRDEGICWEGKVHERITGCKTYSHLPPQEELSLYHHKTIDKQEKQNKLYDMLL
jgi:glycosyltransferase involved in cell wall biosynthesis|tara:strand:+ start:1051 stop:1674 length:624 start_codon:yes stop_codon:yes gene_type:complete